MARLFQLIYRQYSFRARASPRSLIAGDGFSHPEPPTTKLRKISSVNYRVLSIKEDCFFLRDYAVIVCIGCIKLKLCLGRKLKLGKHSYCRVARDCLLLSRNFAVVMCGKHRSPWRCYPVIRIMCSGADSKP